MNRSRLLLATSNKGKLEEFRSALVSLPFDFASLQDFRGLPPPSEDGTTFRENARLKAQHYSQLTGLPTLADDSGLCVDALGGAPGIYSKRYAATDAERIQRLLRELKGFGEHERSARFVCALCFFSPEQILEVEATVEGKIIKEPRGTSGFGYDPIFWYPPLGRTFGELSRKEKNLISHRGKALAKLHEALQP
ncbi:MAG: RdgB/HAM1 family non-canonical purine NTP pyrophosphatase [Acidobacteria bacterium]|nr:RdgB/HAM1 family non-canonical purine NTP pyrophosphatase [Acidobacteriota bacterium]